MKPRFSTRCPAEYEPNGLNLALAARRAAGGEVLDLTLSNPTRAGIAYPRADLLAALRDPRALTYEPTPRGLLSAREAVAAYHAARGQNARVDRLMLTGSTSEAYSWLFRLLCEAGDDVLVPRPSYPLFECLATLDAVHVIEYSLPEELGWAIDFDALERVRTPRSRAVVVVNPNNPTGAFLKRREWLRLQRWAAERGLAIIADEVFADYGYGVETGSGVLMWTHQSVPAPDAATGRVSSFEATGEALVFTLSGLSKVAGLPQMKLGWVHASGPDDVVQHALERLEWIADAYLPVSAPVQHAAARWLELAPSIQHAIAERCLVNLSTARTAFGAACGARALPAEGGWCVVLDMPRLYGEEEWTLRLLERAGVLLQPGFFYDYEREALLVASLLVEPATFADGLKRVEHTLLEA